MPFKRPETPLIPVVLSSFLLAGGCATGTVQGGDDGPSPAPAVASGTAEPDRDTTAAAPARPSIELTGDLLYRLMLAEIAGQRGELGIALDTYLDLARSTRDVQLAERATRIAVYARDVEAATEAAEIWVEQDPTSADAHQVLAVMALRRGDEDMALAHLEAVIDNSRGALDETMLMIANLLGREQDHERVLALLERLVQTRNDSPEALYAFAHVAARLNRLDRAAELLGRAQSLAPADPDILLSYVSVLQRLDRSDEAVAQMDRVLKQPTMDQDTRFRLRMAYARLLADVRDFDAAKSQFGILAADHPDDADVQFALGLLELQGNRLDAAEGHFRKIVESAERGDDASYYLGRIAEERKDLDRANVWYLGVQSGDNWFDAQVRLGFVLAKQDRLADARTHLHSVRGRNAAERALLVQAEGEILVDRGMLDEAMLVYDRALQSSRNSDLLYARAMLAEKMNRLDILERDLRDILEKDPDNAQALNALGYTLADRTDRFDEAHDLIKRALDISPSDFYILDSMGWVLYRMGRLDEAEQYLRKALLLRADPEVAAHLGEVLWVKGDRNGANDVWNTALRQSPGDIKLLDVIRRFKE